MPNDLVRLAIDRAVIDHGSRDQEFTVRRFLEAMVICSGMKMVDRVSLQAFEPMAQAILVGRADVERRPGGRYGLVP